MVYSSQKVISFGFGLMLLFLILITTVSLTNVTVLHDKIDVMVNVRNVKINLISDMRNIARERSLSLYRMVLLQDPFDIDEEKTQMSLLAGQFLKDRDQLTSLPMTADEKKQLEETLELVYDSTRTQKKLLGIIQNESFEEAKKFLMDTAIPKQNHLLKNYDLLLGFQNEISENEAVDAENTYHQTLIFLIVFSSSIIIIGILVSLYVIKKSISSERQLREVNETLETRVFERTTSLNNTNQELQATIETLKDTQDQLVQAEKMASLGNLVAGVAHEINTPVGVGLTAITFLQEQEQALHKQYEDDTITREHLESFLQESNEACNLVVSNIKRAATIIENFKRIAVDQTNEQFSVIDLSNYFNDIIMSLNPKIKQTKVIVSNCCSPGLTLYTNPGVIYQVISNLILNSILHGYEPQDEGVISINAKQEADHIDIKFCDDGKGIPEENLKKIFDPFFTTRRTMGGTGLGLNIVFNLITSTLHGNINVESKPNKGTCFLINIPILNANNENKNGKN